MKEKIQIDKELYDYINKASLTDNKEEIMIFGGKKINDTIQINTDTFKLFDDELVKRDKENAVIYLNSFINEVDRLKNSNCDVVFMVHSHYSKFKSLEFMYGDLSDEDEEVSKKLRLLCNKYEMDYYDGITTGTRIYFWSTKGNNPRLLDCYIDNKKVDYNRLTEITETIEHRMK